MRAHDESGKFARTDNIKMHKGYRVIYNPDHPHSRQNGYVYEHISVMEKALGRQLTGEEVVHHRDGNKLNNSPENLVIFPNQSEHMRHHWKARALKYKLRDGRVVTINDMAEMTSVSPSTIYQRLKKLRWTADEIVYGRS